MVYTHVCMFAITALVCRYNTLRHARHTCQRFTTNTLGMLAMQCTCTHACFLFGVFALRLISEFVQLSVQTCICVAGCCCFKEYRGLCRRIQLAVAGCAWILLLATLLTWPRPWQRRVCLAGSCRCIYYMVLRLGWHCAPISALVREPSTAMDQEDANKYI